MGLEQIIKVLQTLSTKDEGYELDSNDLEAIDEALEYLRELKDLSEMVKDFREQTQWYEYR